MTFYLSKMNPPNCPAKAAKFTRGEKCIYIHLILTFVLIIVSVITYFVHLCLVDHPGTSYLDTRRFSQLYPDVKDVTKPDYLPIGVLYLNITSIQVVCNTIHLRETWSIAPAHCVIIRTDPSMAQLLPKWAIKYRAVDMNIIVTRIKRSIAHPHFNRDDFSNNIGLLEHTISIPMHQYISFNKTENNDNYASLKDSHLRIGSWDQGILGNKGNPYSLHFVNSEDRAKCYSYVSAVVDIRSYEHCITLQNKTTEVSLHHGAALLQVYDVTGLFSWGDRKGKSFPFVILNIANFNDWLLEVVMFQTQYGVASGR